MTPPPDPLGNAITASWRRFLDTYEPLRPELYRYCRHLCRNPWDAEDLTQEALSRAFVTLAMMDQAPQHPRAWLFRVASNAWFNIVRRQREVPLDHALQAIQASSAAEPRGAREAAGTLLTQLSPQERAAVVLKDAFGLSLEEVALALSTTTGAVKTALHRGRTKLVDTAQDEPAPVVPAVLNAFCDAFNQRDLPRLTSLLLSTATMDYPGFKVEDGAQEVTNGSLQGTLFGCSDQTHPVDIPTPRCEVAAYRGEPILLWWSGDEVHGVVRVDVDGDRIVRLRNYYHAPEVLSEVCRELQKPFSTHGYRPTTTTH